MSKKKPTMESQIKTLNDRLQEEKRKCADMELVMRNVAAQLRTVDLLAARNTTMVMTITAMQMDVESVLKSLKKEE